jgi:hypothetical protein
MVVVVLPFVPLIQRTGLFGLIFLKMSSTSRISALDSFILLKRFELLDKLGSGIT